MQSRQRGFTLIELMAAVAIVGLLAGIAAPAYWRYIGKAEAAADYAAVSAYRSAVDAAVLHHDGEAQTAADFKKAVGIVANADDSRPTLTAPDPKNKVILEKGVITLTRHASGEWECTNESGVDLRGCPKD
ncbi:pilin [Halomonas piscis]|uniref:pilin n=1 Tax=Halomonas piscis TaxID=3031727 RepID=UPI00289AEEBF|nr:prepilin-type N-terminal cleavage/methylation domain-containing protein [Halomonas piscis]